MKICDICGQSGVEVEDLDFNGKLFDACTICDNEWGEIDAKLRKQTWNQYYAHKDEKFAEFRSSKGATNETPDNR